MSAIELYYENYGTGMPLILLHGYPLDHTIWLPLVPFLEDRAQLILPDLRGHGKSPAPDGVYTMQEMAGDVVALMDKLCVEKAVLGGHSMGGYVALAFARAYPERFMGLALIASHAFADSEEKKMARMQAIEVVKEQGVATALAGISQKLTQNDGVQEKVRALIACASTQGVIGTLQGMAARRDSLDVLSSLDVPAVIITGAQDVLIPLKRAKEMEQKMKRPWLATVQGVGHMLMMEQPEQLAKVLSHLLVSN
ncbi:MAG TPA: alpha/beta hydrolase [Anaerolineae bacterium]|nr:alpha/beta hydrolase [Anaerolineae bacterium]